MRLIARDSSTLRLHVVRARSDRHSPQLDPHRGFRGIAAGVLLGAASWAMLVAAVVAAYRWFGN
jgi:hypothetical protein